MNASLAKGKRQNNTKRGAFPLARRRLEDPTRELSAILGTETCKCVSVRLQMESVSVCVCVRVLVCVSSLMCCVISSVIVFAFILHSSTLSLLLPGSHNSSDKLYDLWQLPSKHVHLGCGVSDWFYSCHWYRCECINLLECFYVSVHLLLLYYFKKV